MRNGFASNTRRVSGSTSRMPSWAVSNSRRYRTSERARASAARRRSVASSMASRISPGRPPAGGSRRALRTIDRRPMPSNSWSTSKSLKWLSRGRISSSNSRSRGMSHWRFPRSKRDRPSVSAAVHPERPVEGPVRGPHPQVRVEDHERLADRLRRSPRRTPGRPPPPCTARWRSLTSRKTSTAPTTAPAASRIGAAPWSIRHSLPSRAIEDGVVGQADGRPGRENLGHRVRDRPAGRFVLDPEDGRERAGRRPRPAATRSGTRPPGS